DQDVDPARDLLVLVDDFALPLGQFRLRARGSAGGHNGLESIEAALGSREYARLRIGIGPLPEEGIDAADFVLSPFEPRELDVLLNLMPTLTDAVECWVIEGIAVAMNQFNRLGRDTEDE
ncbi:MAG TPA: aminoacyl-tRNA hydrolase, partial [Candidatus Dormibacteraeota bacterium]|nr:aminoacyl-tRNA hydrolase [Candidatus Dormibacteraeota bacterium]